MNVKDYLPKPEAEEQKVAVQGYVPVALREEVLVQIKKDKANKIKTTWDNLLEGLLRSYLAERKLKK